MVLALLHFYWALGGKHGLDKALPADENSNRLLNPSPLLSLIVGLVLLSFTYIAYKLHIGETLSIIVNAGYGLSALFFLRVIGDFRTVGLFKKVKNTEFATYDTWLYIPLCLFIAINFLQLVL